MKQLIDRLTIGEEYQIDFRPYRGSLWRVYRRDVKYRVSNYPDEDFEYEEFDTPQEALEFMLSSIGGFVK